MQLVTFLSTIDKDSLYSFPSTIFTGKNFDVVFFSMFLQKLRSEENYVVHTVDAESCTYDSLVAQTSISFLGQSNLFWLGDIQKIDAKQRQKIVTYVTEYKGPHCLMLFCNDEKFFKTMGNVIELPEHVTFPLYVRLAQWLYPQYEYWDKGFSHKAFSVQPKIKLDSACLLMQYQRVIGSHSEVFFNEWLDSIVSSESSLFVLSSLFFERNAPKFFDMWSHMKDIYPLQFWLSFWSDQLFRAYSFAHYKKTKQLLKSKKMAYRLPFSFIQRDWNGVDMDMLLHAHKILYDVDYGYKNGANNLQLDYMFSSFLQSSTR